MGRSQETFDDAQEMINHVIKNNLIEAKAVFGLYRANSMVMILKFMMIMKILLQIL